jgi:hypothetical protein
VVCCQVGVSATGRSLVQKRPTDRGVSEYDHEASIMRRLWPARGGCAMGKNYGAFMKVRFQTTLQIVLCKDADRTCVFAINTTDDEVTFSFNKCGVSGSRLA